MRRRDTELLSAMFQGGEDATVRTGLIEDGVDSPLVESGILVRGGELEEWDTQDEPYFTPILHDRQGRPYYTDGAIHTLTGDDIQLWRIDAMRFAEIIAETFDCSDGIREVVPGELWNLGRTSETIGRFAMREVYFAPRIASSGCTAIRELPKDARAYILIAGWIKSGCELAKETLQHVFPFQEALELSGSGVWKVCRDRIDRRFAPVARSASRKPDPKFEKKKEKLEQLFYDLCFALRKTEDYERLCAERERLKTGEAISSQLGFDRNFVSRMIGKDGQDPVAVFWRGIFMNQEKFDLFAEWVKPNVLLRQRKGPVQLKEDLAKYMGQKAVEAAMKLGNRK